MDFMTILLYVLRGFLIALGLIVFFAYVVVHLVRRVPPEPFAVKLQDVFSYLLVALLLGLGFNSTWAAGAFLLLMVWKYFATVFFVRDKLQSGRWLEVKWQRITPKGLNNIPSIQVEQLTQEIEKLPREIHVLVPRFLAHWALKYFLKKLRQTPNQLKGSTWNAAVDAEQVRLLLEGMVKKILELPHNHTEKLSLPIGVLIVTRL